MKHKKRVTGRQIGSLRASEDRKRECSTPDGERPRRGEGGPEEGLEGWARLRRLMQKRVKKRITLYLDADVLAFFKDQGPRYQRLINWTLREVMEEETKNRVRGG